MPTIIDSLLVTLGLDTSDFEKGEKRVSQGQKGTREEADKTAKSLETANKKAAQSFATLRNEALGLFLAIQGAGSIEQFVAGMVTGDAATGRLAKNLGVSTVHLSAYGLAVKSVGGDAKDAEGAFTLLAQARDNLKLHGTTGHDMEFARLGFKKGDLDDPAKAMDKLAEAAQHMSRPLFHTLAGSMGISDGVINLLELGPDKMRKLVEAREADAAATEQQSEEAEKLQAAWADLSATLTGLLRPAIYSDVEALLALTNGATKDVGAFKLLKSTFDQFTGVTGFLDPFLNPLKLLSDVIEPIIQKLGGLESAWAHIVWLTHGFIGGQEAYDWLVKGGVKSSGDISGFLTKQDAGGAAGGGSGGGGGGDAPGGAIGGAGNYRGQAVGKTQAGAAYIKTYLKARGLSDSQAAGIAAGIAAEGGSIGGWFDKAGHETFGIGQWRGGRLKNLKAKYGGAPSLAQQLEFLLGELHGGDPGGRSVLGQGSADATLVAYLRDFMRPQGAHGEHYKDLVADISRARRALGGGGGGRGGGNSSVTIGAIHVNAPHANAKHVADEIPKAIRRRQTTGQASQALS